MEKTAFGGIAAAIALLVCHFSARVRALFPRLSLPATWAAPFIALLLLAPGARAQGTLHNGEVRTTGGAVGPGATVTVCAYSGGDYAGGSYTGPIPCTPTVTIYNEPTLTVTQSNPMKSNSVGEFRFYAAAGAYTVTVQGRGLISKGYEALLQCVPGAPNNSCGVPIATVSQLSGFVPGPLVMVTDGTSATDCNTGGGSTRLLCEYNGSAWEAFTTAGASSWSALKNPTGLLDLSMGTNPSQFEYTASGGMVNSGFEWDTNTPAISGQNNSSPWLQLCGDYYAGGGSQKNCWQLQQDIGTGVSPTATLELDNSGTGGALAFAPAESTTTLGTSALPWAAAYADQLISVVPTGTPPLQVASTTQVANLDSATAGAFDHSLVECGVGTPIATGVSASGNANCAATFDFGTDNFTANFEATSASPLFSLQNPTPATPTTFPMAPTFQIGRNVYYGNASTPSTWSLTQLTGENGYLGWSYSGPGTPTIQEPNLDVMGNIFGGTWGGTAIGTAEGGTGQLWGSSSGLPALLSGTFSLYNTNCNTSGVSALTWTTGTGLGCNTIGGGVLTTLGDFTYGGVAGAPTRLPGPTSPNGVAQMLCETPASGAATAPGWCNFGDAAETYTTSQTLAAADSNQLATFNCASACTATLPSAPPSAQWNVAIQAAVGGSAVTIAPNGLNLTICGSTSTSNFTIPVQGETIFVTTAGSNYFATCPLTPGPNVALTPGSSGIAVSSTVAPPILGFSAYGLSVPTVTGLGLTTGYGDSGTYAVTDTALGVNFADTANLGPQLEGSLTAYPGVPFTYTAVFSVMPQANLAIGLCAAASATAASECVYEHGTGTVQPFSTDIEDWSAPATYSATVGTTQIKFIGGPYLWMRYQDDGTNITYSISEEGINWNTVYTVAKTADYLNANGGFNFFGVIISTDAGPGGTIMLGQKMTTP